MPVNLSIVDLPRPDADLSVSLTAVLERFVPSVSAQAMVRSVLTKAERTGDASPAAMLRNIESTAKILIPPSRREAALTAIRNEIVTRASSDRSHGRGPERDHEPEQDQADEDETVVVIRKESDVSPCRMVARQACDLVGVRGYRAQRIVTGVSELARNIAHYAGEGRVRVCVDTQTELIRIIAEDRGPGIANLDEILAGDYRSRTGLGRGLLGVRKLADEFEIQTGSWGTRVTAAFSYGGYPR